MKIYILIRDYEDIAGVFESRSEAEAYLALNVPKEDQMFGTYIREYDTIQDGTWSCRRYRKAFIFEYDEEHDILDRYGDFFSTEYIEKVVEYNPDGYWSGTIPYQGDITNAQCRKIVKKLIEFEKAKMRGEVD